MRKIFALLTILFIFGAARMAAQERAATNIRYVTKAGRYANDGTSWENAKNNVQDAINDLVDKGLQGEVWVARGTYTPTESTESTGGNSLYMSFKVPAGITVRGGFFGPGNIPGMTKTADGKVAAIHNADSIKYFRMLMEDTYEKVLLSEEGVTVDISGIESIRVGDDFPAYFPGETHPDQRATYKSNVKGVSQDATYPYISVLSGDLSKPASFEWNATKNYWDASFYGNSYHVVWFANNGFDSDGRAKPLDTSVGEAVVEGFTIMNGNARNNELNYRAHNAYGGGVYMVKGSRLKNCHVQQCEASRDGGAIYMDGGGVVEHCYVQNSQALGIGAQNGYGGGVCLETNKQYTTSRMGMYRSVISGCVGRMGGGVAIKTENHQFADSTDLRYNVFLSSTAIYNNTATIEAGGLYMNGGGAVSNLTITRNQCNGTGVISNGMVTGRAGGLYCRDHTVVLNSVLWGNECKNNKNLQFASSQSATDPGLKVDMKYCAVALANYTDWSNTAKEGIYNLSNYNTVADRDSDADATASDDDLFPHFNTPTPNAGYVATKVDPTDANSQSHTQSGLRRYYDWQPGTNSVLANGGILALDLNPDGDLPFTSLYQDILGNDFNPRPTLGGYTRKFGTMTATEKTGESGAKEYHFYVDPNASSARAIDETEQGVSWEHPARFLSNVLFSVYNDKTGPGETNKYAAEGVKTYIHVKEGTLDNTNSYVYDKRVREMTVGVRSGNLEILGGYPKQLTGINTEQTIDGVDYVRNPLLYPTFISGRITGEYRMNASHLMQFDACENVVFDGFQIRYANASSPLFDTSGNDGGAIRLINGAKNITFRNLVIADNTADRGAAIFAEDGTSATFENVIIHNNESKKVAGSDSRQGIIHTLGNARLTFNHCNILNNVGYPGYLDGTSTQTYTNTLFFANGKEMLSEAYGENAVANALPSFTGANATAGATGSYCLFDSASAGFRPQFGTHPNAEVAKYQYNLNYELNKEGYPRFVNGVHNVGVSEGGDETFYGRATSFEPHNENPMVNAASYTGAHTTWGYDLSTVTPRTYGGLPDIGAIENHADILNRGGGNSNPDGQQPYGGVVYVRDYNTYETETDADGNTVFKLDENGDRILVEADTEIYHDAERTKLRDGSSWENAINGNATYKTSTITVTKAFSPSTFSEILSNGASCKIEQRRAGQQKRYLKSAANGSYQQTTSEDEAHEFRFELKAGTSDEYYIYDETVAKYLYCTDPTANAQNLVKTWDDLRTDIADVENATWYIKDNNDIVDGYSAYLIYPYSRKETTNNWNYHSGGNLGLWSGVDNTSRWVFYAGEVVDTDEQTDVDVNGLQFAIDNACYEGAHPIYTLTTSKDWTETASHKEHYTAATLPITPYTTELLDRSGWTVTVSSWHRDGQQGDYDIATALKDGNADTYWHSNWDGDSETQGGGHGTSHADLIELPEYLIIDLGAAVDNICALAYTPRNTGNNGRLLSYKVFVSENPFVDNDGDKIPAPASNDNKIKALDLTGEVASGTIAYTDQDKYTEKMIPLNTPTRGRYIMLLWCGSTGNGTTENNKYATCSEINVYKETSAAPTYFVLQNRGVNTRYMKWSDNSVTSAATLDANALFSMYSYNGKNYLRAYNNRWMNATASTVDSKKTIGLTSQIVDNANYTIEESEDWPMTYLLFKNNNYLNNDGGGGGLIFWSGNSSNSQWLVKKVNITTADGLTTVAEIDGTTSRIHTVNYNTITESGGGKEREQPLDVYVGAGTYKGNYFMKNGVSVLGGFPATGNPGENERNISNKVSDYMTVLDGQSFFRVLTQSKNFGKETTVEGFVIKNGETFGENQGAGVQIRQNGVLKNCLVEKNIFTLNHFSPNGNYGGGGIYMFTGSTIKNSTISENHVYNGDNTQVIGGGGVFASGGSLQNSLIVRNEAHNDKERVLGAALYISNTSYFYNCTIAYNFGDKTGSGYNAATGGVWDNGAKKPNYEAASHFYNCILWGNYGTGGTGENMLQVGMEGWTDDLGLTDKAFHNCYSSAPGVNITSDVRDDPEKVFYTNTGDTRNPSSEVAKSEYTAFIDSCRKYQPFAGTWENTDFSLVAKRMNDSNEEVETTAKYCINKGTEQELLEELGITEDIVGNNRVIDCTVDKGAYEYYDSYAITPRRIYKEENGVQVVDKSKAATFYVTPEGRGLASGDSPANAACAQKLQRVLDAAGRYKYQNPDQQIIVKVAHSDKLAEKGEDFQYYATRTTDETNADVRVWSIIVPRGVEVWGGYCDSYTDDNDNGFYKNTVVDGVVTETKEARDITMNPTYFDSYYMSTELNSGVNTYHVVTFTDRVFDGDGLPYMAGDKIGEPSSYGLGRTTGAPELRNAGSTPSANSVDAFMLMSEPYSYNDEEGLSWGSVNDRAVLDGIYITSGQADLQTISSGSTTLNINRYGGAAIVTDYAHVRNCIIRNNKSVYGGALALTHNALVSGCLIDRNEADYGGAIYVFEHGARLSDGTVINTENADYREDLTDYQYRYDREMPHVYSSTIVNNSAEKQGGGVWYGTAEANVRFNSTVVWANNCPDQPNVSGLYNITRADNQLYATTEYYPFNYCAVQNIQASGLNNLSLSDRNIYGARFQDATKTDDRNAMALESGETGFEKYSNFGFYGLTNYSILNRGGMPVTEWEKLNTTRNLSLAANDFMNVSRMVADKNLSTVRNNIDIGARAFDKYFPNEELMLRIYVAKPEDVDVEASVAMMQHAIANPDNAYAKFYGQEGSSFAYPMTRLQDALDYIYKQRGFVLGDDIDEDCKGLTEYHANNMLFEIWLGPGVYYPTFDPSGDNNHSAGATFIIPEGVSLIGGYDPSFAVDRNGNAVSSSSTEKHFYGKDFIPRLGDEYYDPVSGAGKSLWEQGFYYLASNSKADPKDLYEFIHDGVTYKLHHVNKDTCNKRRAHFDINANSIIEPWELANQTILSGQLEGVENNGVNHIVTIHADQSYVGALPFTQKPSTGRADDTHDIGYEPHEFGQIISFDGLTFQGGYAHGYHSGTVNDEHKLKYNHGGAILIDTNRYWNLYNKKIEKTAGLISEIPDTLNNRGYLHGAFTGAAGYREVPVIISKCKFENNVAGYGGAISSNTTLDVLNSSFEHNKAMSGADVVDYTFQHQAGNLTGNTYDIPVTYPGAGGAIYATYQISAINCLFANNEALDTKFQKAPQSYSVLTSGIHQLRVAGENNKEVSVDNIVSQSSLFGGSGGAVFASRKAHFHLMNCNFVRNQANAYPAVFTYNPNPGLQIDAADVSMKDYNQVINCVFWGNAINEKVKTTYAADPTYLYSIDKIVNYGRSGRTKGELYRVTTEATEMPLNQTDLDDDDKFAEQVWFSAYEDGRGKKAKNNLDLRDMDFYPRRHVKKVITDYITTSLGKPATDYQNCNVQLAEENAVNEGPNFVNPSGTPGYDGYMESADWSPARINRLTDYGWGKIKQQIKYDQATNTYKARFMLYGDKVSEDGTEVYEPPTDIELISKKNGDYVTWGAYTALRHIQGNEKYNKTVPLGNDKYMFTTYNYNERSGNPIDLYRISYDPNPSHEQTYIDIGVYEYYHTQLEPATIEGEEVDVLWVSPTEKPDNGRPDGSSWARPTSDLQRAIETLLASRNGHRKEIRVMDGTFIPTYTINGHLAFNINTTEQNKSTMVEIKDGVAQYNKGVMSLTIKGGYSRDLNGVRDIDEYPAIIRQQERTDTDENNHRWDYLFYIDDSRQRYGKATYSDDNAQGLYEDESDESKKNVNTIPIQFEGLTLINASATETAQGAVIHYSDLTETDAVTPTPTNVTTSYESDTKTDEDVLDNPAKIVINKTKVYGSGAHDRAADRTLASAVYIGTNGGHALLYNNVMHSNYGKPLFAKCKTYTVNNTFALNGKEVDMGDTGAAGSYIRNSVLWLNNSTGEGTYGAQFSLQGFNTTLLSAAENKDLFSYNAYTGGDILDVDYSTGGPIDKKHNNVGLLDNNEDFIYSPNFVDPFNTEVAKRDFSLQPSLRLLNKGSNANYDTLAVKAVTVDGVSKMQIDPAGAPYDVYDLAYEPSFNLDAAHKKRQVNKRIDIGAYEYQNDLNRVIYFNPNVGGGGDGKNWSTAFGLVEDKAALQDAINLAALYHVNNPTEQAYVFVKGASTLNKDLHIGEMLTIRNGVSVYGGIHPSFIDECGYTPIDANTREYSTEDINNYVKSVMGHHEGHIGPNTNKTTVLGFRTNAYTKYDEDTDNIFSLIDGFHVTAKTANNPTGETTTPLISVTPQSNKAKVALRNIVVHDNNISGVAGGNLAQLQNALLYEALFRNNETAQDGAVLCLDEDAWAVNITAEGRTKTKVGSDYLTPYNGYGNAATDADRTAAENTNRIKYSLVNFRGQDADVAAVESNKTLNTLSGHNYVRTDRNMYYQLTEGSKHINEIEIPDAATANNFLPVKIRPFINYTTDRDLLGNPRLLTLFKPESGKESYQYLDRGAFETWRVEKDVTTTTTGHFTPHTGSVVYIMEGNSLVCGTDFQPGFLLLQEGANLYGNGNNVKVSFVSVERTIHPNGTVMSLPFEMDYSEGKTKSDGVAIPTYKDAPDADKRQAIGELILTPDPDAEILTYNGSDRSEWNHHFEHENSQLWSTPTTTVIPANQGVFFKPSKITKPTTYAFTAMGASWYNNVYTEETDEHFKQVKLAQYDDRDASVTDNDGHKGADFTSPENMGWNCIGLPYLVSNYETHKEDYAEAGGATNAYNMHLPHTFWLYYEGTVGSNGQPVGESSGFYSVPSWEFVETTDANGNSVNNWNLPEDEAPRIWMTEGFFVQTATLADSTDLIFYRPVPPTASSANKLQKTFNKRHYSSMELEEKADHTFSISVRGRTVYVRGLNGDESIAIYDTAGRCYVRTEAGGAAEWSRELPSYGIYIVAVDEMRRKVLVK